MKSKNTYGLYLEKVMFNEFECAKYHRGGTTSKLTAGSKSDTPENYDAMTKCFACERSVSSE